MNAWIPIHLVMRMLIVQIQMVVIHVNVIKVMKETVSALVKVK